MIGRPRNKRTETSNVDKERSQMKAPRTHRNLPRFLGALAAAALCIMALGAASASASFGIVSFEAPTTANEGGDPAVQAGSHPFAATTDMDFTVNEEVFPPAPEGQFRNLVVELPPGLVGNPSAAPKCSMAEFYATGLLAPCPNNTAIGTVLLKAPFLDEHAPVFNLNPGPGEPARFGFRLLSVSVFLDASVRTGEDYGTTITVPNVSQSAPCSAPR